MNENVTFSSLTFSSMLPLDMLAEVASETLKNDPSLSVKNEAKIAKSRNFTKVCSPKKSASTSELLTLDQIRMLSDKMLLEMFSEHASDEIRRTFSYKCFLIPESCHKIFSSFGSETKAHLQMKTHLLSHITELLAEANAPENDNIQFMAEPLHIRRKKLQESCSKKRKRSKYNGRKVKNSPQLQVVEKKNNISKVKSVKRVESKTQNISKMTKIANIQSLPIKHEKDTPICVLKSKSEKENNDSCKPNLFHTFLDLKSDKADINSDLKKIRQKEIVKVQNCDAHSAIPKKTKFQSKKESIKPRKVIENSPDDNELDDTLNADCRKNGTRDFGVNCENGSLIKSNLMTESTVLSQCTKSEQSSQAHHDHTYTSVNGKTLNLDNSLLGDGVKSTGKMARDGKKARHLCSGISSHLIIPTPAFPYVYVPLLPHIAEVKELGNINKRSCDKCSHHSSSEGKKTNDAFQCLTTFSNRQIRYRRVNKVIIPEEMESGTEDDENVPCSFPAEFIEDRLHAPELSNDSIVNGAYSLMKLAEKNSTDNLQAVERKLALKCIRALRTKKKDERGPLVCQICKDKSFTAQATLMYHYRSHAGIKPFSCAVCDATFTRQHSLNYHMLIHDNKSRFVCTVCGRNFRHPSHFKEHMRRHTGETPYECKDCNLKFKTRNTYKRHLKTRHGKILTARGIRVLSVEEFNKVRTSPRKRTPKHSPLPKRDQETQWPDISFAGDEILPDVKMETF